MDFEWDERKRLTNLDKHGLDFVEVEEMFQGPILVALDNRNNYREDRWLGLGMSQGRVLVVAFSERNDGQTIRVISLRKALKYEQKAFEKIFHH
ncbi:MAG: BrnT family toxin [Woeseia sp.]|nr:BrnT family toxin [Woeseia sp.]